ncbi:hypothetical protein L7F22_014945 [Adiantum nelumboides]|nr:hypothetical protein [Adiantum nelumboides]
MAALAPVLGTTQDAPRPVTWTYALTEEDETEMQTAIEHFSGRTLVGRLVWTTTSRSTVREWIESALGDSTAQGAASQPIPILPPPSLPDPPASPVITPSTSHPVPPIQPPDVSPYHALSDSDSDLDVADATPEVGLAPPRQEKRIPGWLYSTVASSGVTELPVPPPAGLPRRSARLQKRGQISTRVSRPVDILLVQEHKLSYAHTQRCGKLLPGGSHTFWEPAMGDHLSSGGVCIFVGSRWLARVIDHGTLVSGKAMWISLQCDASVVGIRCIYAPTATSERSWFWDQIIDVLPSVDSWIVRGDFNNVETFEDCRAAQPPALHILRDGSLLLKRSDRFYVGHFGADLGGILSIFSVNLAVALAFKCGIRVGILDADVYGPSIPTMMKLQGHPKLDSVSKMIPLENYGVRCMSMGFLMEEGAPAVWRGPMINR